MRLTAHATALGISLPGRQVESQADESAQAPIYDAVLAQLRGIVQQAGDLVASNLAKGAARQVKYLKEIDRNGRLFAAHELDDIFRLLDAKPSRT